MHNLAGDKTKDTFPKTSLQYLPVNIHSIVFVSGKDLVKVATMANKIWELNTITLQIAATLSRTVNTGLTESLQKQISELSLKISKFSICFIQTMAQLSLL